MSLPTTVKQFQSVTEKPFTDALARLPSQEQKAAKTSAFDLQMDLSSPGLQFQRTEKSQDPNFWSMRVNRDFRIIPVIPGDGRE